LRQPAGREPDRVVHRRPHELRDPRRHRQPQRRRRRRAVARQRVDGPEPHLARREQGAPLQQHLAAMRSPAIRVAALLALAACGGGGAGPAAPPADPTAGTIAGSVNGTSWTTLSSAWWIGKPATGSPPLIVFLFEAPVRCSDIVNVNWDKTATGS